MALIPKTAAELAQLAPQALKARRARQTIKQQLHGGRIALSEVLDLGKRGTGDPILGRLRVGQVLDSVPGVGPVTVDAILIDLELDAHTHLDELTAEQRGYILARLTD